MAGRNTRNDSNGDGEQEIGSFEGYGAGASGHLGSLESAESNLALDF